MVARRPFGDDAALVAAADESWWSLHPGDWLEAFATHPRIGDRQAGGFSRREQAAASTEDERLRTALENGNRTYEERFGHVFLICATGRSAASVLEALEARLGNDAATELRNAAAEQAAITRLRLERLAEGDSI